MRRKALLLAAALVLSSAALIPPSSAQAAQICSCAWCLDKAHFTCYGSGRVEWYCGDFSATFCPMGD